MFGFRVLLNLNNYFSDYRRKSWIYVDRERFNTITELKKHICEVFPIDGEFEIFISDTYVPSTECISIISEGDVLEIKNSAGYSEQSLTIENVSMPEERIEGEFIPEEKKKRRKKRKSNDIENVGNTTVTLDPLPEYFHPDYNSTMTTQKKRKKSKNCTPMVDSMENLTADYSKNQGKKKSKQKEENSCIADEIAVSSAVQFHTEDLINSTVASNDSVFEKRSKVIHLPLSKEVLETRKDSQTLCDSVDVIEKTSNETSDLLSSHQSVCENSLLEHTIYERAVDVNKNESEHTHEPFKKRKRIRHRKRKPKNISRNNLSAMDHKANLSSDRLFLDCTQSSLNTKPNSRSHMRFSESEEDDKMIKSSPSEAIKQDNDLSHSKSISMIVDPNILNGTSEVNNTFSRIAADVEKSIKVCDAEAASEEDNVKLQETDVNSQSVDWLSIEKMNVQCTLDKKDSTNSLCAQVSSSFVKDTVKRTRKAVINTGLGATLAHLMKDNKKSEEKVPSAELCPPETILRPSKPPPVLSDKQTSKSKKFYNEFPIVEKFPREGDILAFKILKMNENYEPCISNFMEGAVTSCGQNQSTVTIKILEGVKELDRTHGKFDIHLEDEELKSGNEDVVLSLEWKDVIEPRLVFP